MKNQLVVMAIGPDRVGLVAQVTGFIRERGGNVEDSRMAVLGSEFGAMVLVSGSEAQIARIEQEKGLLGRAGLDVILRRTTPLPEGRSTVRAVLVAEALDHEGIVHSVAAAIERLGVSIASLETAAYPAPLSGGPLFRIIAELELPSAIDIEAVRRGLAEVAEAENLDLHVNPKG